MMRRFVRVAVIAVALAVLGVAMPGRAFADSDNVTVVSDTPFSQSVVSACTGEVITMQGSMRGLTHVNFDNAGGGHFRFFVGTQASGSSAAGVDYRYSDTTSVEQNFPSGNSFNFSVEVNSRLVTSGPNNNQKAHLTLHFTFANGELTSEVINSSVDCQ